MTKITIGRDTSNDVVFENISTISNFHSEIIIDESGNNITYTDHSSNGSWINNQKIQNTSVIISRNDKIVLPGDCELDLLKILPQQETKPASEFANTVVEQQTAQQQYQQPQEQYQQPQQQYQQPQQQYQQPQQQYQQPQQQYHQPQQQYQDIREQLPTSRGLLKMILLGAITFGIYPIVVICKISTEINTVARADYKHTMHYLLTVLLTPVTLGIIPLIWYNNLCNRIGNELKRRNIRYDFSASDFWLWAVLGSLIAVGPFIFIHKFMHAMNKINGSYNQFGE
ncbi:MAG: DUF4234 domain-containing protein [Bacteroidaceae bacterium]|nr:DUF4234 domain-containing protein [Bacteroidaceae bacterium]